MVKHRKLKSQKKSRNRAGRQNPPDIKFFESMLVGVLTDCHNTLPFYGCTDYTKDVATLKKRLHAEGVGFAALTLPVLSQGLFDLLEGRSATFPGFKIQSGTEYPVFMRALYKEALRDREKAAPAVKAIYQLSVLFKKVEGPMKKHRIREQYADFVAVDEALGRLDITSEVTRPILERAKSLFREFADHVDMEDFTPRPGPGATNTKREKNLRYGPKVLYEQIDNVLPYQEYFYTTPWQACLESRAYLDIYKNRVSQPTARYKVVPKKYGTGRGICIEENESQWFQQGLARVLVAGINRHPLYKDRIQIHNQNLNASYALYSSETRSFGTLDESEASDRIWRKLVHHLSEDTVVHKELMALSTRWIMPPKECADFGVLRTNKYAPMGSGLCFPVMCLVHMMLIRAIIQLSDVADPVGLSRQVYVYGDDLIVPSSAVQAVYDYLPLFGMKINTTKSFVKSYFRESCGTHAYNGVNVTPVFVKKVPNTRRKASLASLLSAENQLFKAGFCETAMLLREYLAITYNLRKVYCPLGSPLVGYQRDPRLLTFLLQYANIARTKWKSKYQCRIYDVPVFVSRDDSLTIRNQAEALLRWYVQRPELESDAIGVPADQLTVRRRWMLESHLNQRAEPTWFQEFLKRDQNDLTLLHAGRIPASPLV